MCASSNLDEAKIRLAYDSHDRLSEYDRLVYPVVSRRSRGLSLGINLNPDQRCNFDCVYCQVDRQQPLPRIRPQLASLEEELGYWLRQMQDGQYQGYQLQDIALAGDGEPTSEKILPQVLELLLRLKAEAVLPPEVRLVLFTNGSGIDRHDLASIFPAFFAAQGEVWFKLDYWNQRSLEQINRTRLKFETLLAKLVAFGRQYPLVLQCCFFQWQGQHFNEQLYRPFAALVTELCRRGVMISKLQAYTLARKPAEADALPWSDEEMNRLAAMLRSQLAVTVELFYENGSEVAELAPEK